MKSDTNRARPTIREVAALSGTSIKTVSRVMNGVTTVDPTLAKAVNQAARKLNYRPNFTAGNLRRVDGRTNTIGLLLKDISNPFSSSLHRAFEDLARAEGFDVIAGSMDEMPERESELINTFISRRVDGLIIVPTTSDHKYLEKERKSGMQFVFVDRPANNFVADTVVATNRKSAQEATEHLINHGHTRIAYMGDSQDIYTAAPTVYQRLPRSVRFHFRDGEIAGPRRRREYQTTRPAARRPSPNIQCANPGARNQRHWATWHRRARTVLRISKAQSPRGRACHRRPPRALQPARRPAIYTTVFRSPPICAPPS